MSATTRSDAGAQTIPAVLLWNLKNQLGRDDSD